MSAASVIYIQLPFTEPEALWLSVDFYCSADSSVIQNIAYIASQDEQIISHDKNSVEFAKRIHNEISCYLSNPQFHFSLNCALLSGTAFQQRVWQALTEIPAGKVMTYGELAKKLNSSARAVGNACRQNRFPLLIPCHRVVAAAGIGGYAGDTLDKQKGRIHFLQIKRWLLSHEQANIC